MVQRQQKTLPQQRGNLLYPQEAPVTPGPGDQLKGGEQLQEIANTNQYIGLNSTLITSNRGVDYVNTKDGQLPGTQVLLNPSGEGSFTLGKYTCTLLDNTNNQHNPGTTVWEICDKNN